MKKHLLMMGVLLTAAFSFSSCLDSDSSSQTHTFSFGGENCFNIVRDIESGDQLISLNPYYRFEYDFTQGTVDVEMSNVQLASGFGGLSFKLPTMKVSFLSNEGFYSSTETNVTPLNTQSSYVFNTFNLRSIPMLRWYNTDIPVWCLNYTVNNRYQVTMYPTKNNYFGTTIATKTNEVGPAANYSGTETGYVVTLNVKDPSKPTATLYVQNSKFSENMPAVNFYVKDLPVSFDGRGYSLHFEGSTFDIYSTANGKKMDDSSISDLVVEATLTSGANINFKCDLGSSYGSYKISSSLGYFIRVDNSLGNATN